MQWLTLVPENSSVEHLKADNRRPAVARRIDTTTPASPAQTTAGSGHSPTATQPRCERRQGERRSGEDRRRRQLPVLLDTRCNHDRRQTVVDETRRPTARRHINLYA